MTSPTITRVLDQLTIAASCRRLGQYDQAREHIALARQFGGRS
jgi:hypothetical protein